jgi:hypothetical protein
VGDANVAQVLALPTVAAISQAAQRADEPQWTARLASDDDTDGELDTAAADEPAPVTDEDFYADALEVLR